MKLDELLEKAQSIAIFGHVRPDGDCIGSCLGLYNYICDNYPEKTVQIFAENFPRSFCFFVVLLNYAKHETAAQTDLAKAESLRLRGASPPSNF